MFTIERISLIEEINRSLTSHSPCFPVYGPLSASGQAGLRFNSGGRVSPRRPPRPKHQLTAPLRARYGGRARRPVPSRPLAQSQNPAGGPRRSSGSHAAQRSPLKTRHVPHLKPLVEGLFSLQGQRQNYWGRWSRDCRSNEKHLKDTLRYKNPS